MSGICYSLLFWGEDMKLKLNIHFIFVIIAASLWGISGLFVRTVSKYGVTEMEMVFWRAIISTIFYEMKICFMIFNFKMILFKNKFKKGQTNLKLAEIKILNCLKSK